MKTIVFRVDSSDVIGTGHVMRCLTLANALKKDHLKVFFVARHIHAEIATLISEQGHEIVLLDYPLTSEPDELKHSVWLRASQATDAKATIDALKNQSIDWVIVDHYALDKRWESHMRSIAKKIMVIDDIADRQHDCDILLDQNYYKDMETRYQNKVPPHCKLMLGPKYVLLRDEFYQARQKLKAKTDEVKRILITFGGVDAENYTAKAIHAISQLTEYELTVDVVIGAQHPNKDEIEQLCKKFGYVCHVQTNKIGELMASADIAIGAGGATSWERCVLGLPTILIPVADNQLELARNAAEAGLLYYPEIKLGLMSSILLHIRAFIENPILRKTISTKAMQAVDGLGVARAVSQLLPSQIVLRKATLEDTDSLFEWRNHPNIRLVSKNTDLIKFEDHQRWLASTLQDNNKFLLIGFQNNKAVGVLRYDVADESAEVSIYLVPQNVLSVGLGRGLLEVGERYLIKHYANVKQVKALVLSHNTSSIKFFEKNSFTAEYSVYSKKVTF